jgi:hypothetical protein
MFVRQQTSDKVSDNSFGVGRCDLVLIFRRNLIRRVNYQKLERLEAREEFSCQAGDPGKGLRQTYPVRKRTGRQGIPFLS